MTDPTNQIDIAERAQFYRVSVRTIYRWLGSHVDISRPIEVARHLVCQRTANPQALEAILSELDADTAELTEEDFSNAK